ncbi:phosphoglycerate dehydrogenase [Pseudothermotoga elfii]|jgi:D-3-phosphoglycerate dehydrogenase
MPKVLVAARTFGRYSQEPVNFLRKHDFEVITFDKEDLSSVIGKVDALIVGTPKVTKGMLVNSRLKIIAKHGVGIDNIDLEAATELGIPVTIAQGANTDSVAELVIGFIFSLARNIVSAHVDVFQRHLWPNIVGTEIQGKTLGLLGFGSIAKEVAKRALCLGMNVVSYDPYVSEEEMQKAGVTSVDFGEIFKISDFVSIHVPLNEKTRNLVGEAELKTMKRTAFLINTARGGIIEEKNLIRALKEKWIKGAALDVFNEEPLNPNSELFTCENVIMTPHMGAHTIEAIYRMNMMAAKAVVDFFEGRIPPHVVNKEVLSKLYRS